MLNATLHKLLVTDGSTVAKDIQQNIYVDNIISGFPSVDLATQYYHKARQNHVRLMQLASNHHSITALAQQDKVADSCTTVNVLGLLWDTVTDTLIFNPKQPLFTQHSLVTKRDIPKDVSKLFDPLGFVSPITMSFKVFIQLWQHKLDWDEPCLTISRFTGILLRPVSNQVKLFPLTDHILVQMLTVESYSWMPARRGMERLYIFAKMASPEFKIEWPFLKSVKPST